jgi:ABC-type nitrate/sulfonate/bicarbonate transport system substrate-binding protein
VVTTQAATLAATTAPSLTAGTTAAATTAATTATSSTTQAGSTTGPSTTVATTGALTTAASTTAAAPASLTKLTLALDWVPNTNHTGIYVALQKGWYKEAGIDLQILPYADGAIPDILVGEGKADLGISGGDGVATYRAAGQPVVSIGAIIQHNTSGFAYLKDSGITRPRDLAGKRYAGFGAAFEEPVIAAVIKKDGGTDTKIQNITTNAGGYQAVAAKQADFVWIFAGWDGIQAKRDKVDLGIFFLKDCGIPYFYTPVIITSDNNVKTKAPALKAFMAATSKGYDYAIANPKDAADLLMAANPKGTFSDPELVYESQAYLSPLYKDDAARWGQQTLQNWTGYQKFLFDNGVLQDSNGKPLTKELDYNRLFTNDFLP